MHSPRSAGQARKQALSKEKIETDGLIDLVEYRSYKAVRRLQISIWYKCM